MPVGRSQAQHRYLPVGHRNLYHLINHYCTFTDPRRPPQKKASAWVLVLSPPRFRPFSARSARSDGSMMVARPACRLRDCCRQIARRYRASSGVVFLAHRSNRPPRSLPLAPGARFGGAIVASRTVVWRVSGGHRENGGYLLNGAYRAIGGGMSR